MAKKKKVEELIPRPHRQCRYCKVVTNEFLSIKGEPIMGECIYSQSRFLLNEKTECKEFK